MDLEVFEDHSPLPRGGRLDALRASFLPRRLLLLRLLKHTLAADDQGAAAAADALLAAVEGDEE
eukprot:6532712-Prymnesium_polylepis.1